MLECLYDKLYCPRLPVLDRNSKYFYCGSKKETYMQ